MKFSLLAAAAAASVTAVSAHLRIILSNDDGFSTANIRATYNELTKQGHKVLIVGPSDNQSAKGGTTGWPTSNLTGTGVHGLLTPGAYFAGTEPGVNNPGITYFNGTPAACVFYGLDVVAPKFFNNEPVDLVVSGINEGSNLGGLVYTLSGTLGAAYVAVGRGIPAVAFSAVNSTHRSYKDWDPENPTDIANIQGKLAADLVSALAYGVDISKGEKVLPVGMGLNVNIPRINSTCNGLPMIQTRMTGGATTDKVVFTAAGFPTWADEFNAPGLNTCINGDCSLPGETIVATTTCQTAVSAFSVDYDSPTGYTESVKEHLKYTVLGKLNTSPGSYKREWKPRGEGLPL